MNKTQGFELKAHDDDVVIDIFEAIGEDFFGDGVSAKSVAEALKPHRNAKTITVNLNSPGGLAFDGITIYNLLHKHKASVTVNIEGMAASSASVIAMAGDEINMAENAMMMIHNAEGFAIGGEGDMRSFADFLSKLDGQIAATYAARTDGDLDTIKDQMSGETWFTADEALADGFATSVTPSKRIAACFNPGILNRFKNAPDNLRASFNPNPAVDPADKPGTKDIDMATKPITPEAFATEQPDAVKNWKAEASLDAAKDEKARAKALADQFPDDPAFALAQVIAGHEVPKAKAEYADVLQARNKELTEQNAELTKKIDDVEDGADALALATGDKPGDKYKDMDAEARIQAQWDDNHEGCQKKFHVLSAYAGYCKSRIAS